MLRGLSYVTLVFALGAAMEAPRAQDGVAQVHHRDGRFQNRFLEFEPRGLLDLLKWRFDAAREGLPRAARAPTPVVAPDLAFIRENARAGLAMQPAVTWIGHATALLQLGGINVLTDPIFSQRASPFGFAGPRRHVAPGVALQQLPHIDLVIVSHNHYDHLDEASVRALAAQAGGSPLFVVPLGNLAWLADVGVTNAVELDWWQAVRVGAVEVVMTPLQHWSGRGLTDRMRTLWGGYALFAPDQHVFFAGDTGYSKDFADIRARFAARQTPALGGGFDLALLPIGAYAPRWFMASQHVDPREAVQVHVDLGAKRSLGIHWGAFELTDEALDDPPLDLARERRARGLADEDFFVLAVGQTQRLPSRAATNLAAAR